MNTITIIVTILVLWLIMGLGFATAYVDARRNNKSQKEAWTSKEGLLFIASVAIPLLVAVFRLLV